MPVEAPPDETAVRAINVAKSYGTAATVVHALRGVSLEVRRGEHVALLGKSGSGKSTLLHILAGLDQPTSGEVWLAGRELSRMTPGDLARYRLKKVGMIFQAFNLILSRSAWQNVELPMIFAGVPPRQRREAAREALKAVGLGARLDHRPTELSGGEQQRVAIARALVNRPQILLADEPTGNLDSDTAAVILELLTAHLREHGTTFILVTHDEDLAHRCAERIFRMKDGTMVNDAAPRREED
jgi:predicted ABC-type transport system involved in lysophospholipase L1 biosynthesis ATPase subunit